MQNVDALTHLLHQKLERKAILGTKIESLNTTSLNLTGSRIGRWFGSSYLLIKRIITLLIGISLLVAAFYFIANPKGVFNESAKKELVKNASDDYFKLIGQTIGETIVESSRKGKLFSSNRINKEFTTAVEHIVEQEIYDAIQFFAFLLIPLALFLLYISRLTKKMRQRNHKISAAQSLAQEIILSYNQEQKYLDQEIEVLKSILTSNYQENSSNSSSL